jgi:hypothetical protein
MSFDTLFLSCVGIAIVLSSFVLWEWGMYGRPCFILDPEMISDLKGNGSHTVKGIIIAMAMTFALFICILFMLLFNVPLVVQQHHFTIWVLWVMLTFIVTGLGLVYGLLKQNPIVH